MHNHMLIMRKLLKISLKPLKHNQIRFWVWSLKRLITLKTNSRTDSENVIHTLRLGSKNSANSSLKIPKNSLMQLRHQQLHHNQKLLSQKLSSQSNRQNQLELSRQSMNTMSPSLLERITTRLFSQLSLNMLLKKSQLKKNGFTFQITMVDFRSPPGTWLQQEALIQQLISDFHLPLKPQLRCHQILSVSKKYGLSKILMPLRICFGQRGTMSISHSNRILYMKSLAMLKTQKLKIFLSVLRINVQIQMTYLPVSL